MVCENNVVTIRHLIFSIAVALTDADWATGRGHQEVGFGQGST